MPVLGVAGHFGPYEGLNRCSCILELEVWHDVDCVVCHSQCIWPEVWSDSAGPSVVCMDEHRACHFLKVPDLPLHNAILMMCCDSGKGEALSLL